MEIWAKGNQALFTVPWLRDSFLGYSHDPTLPSGGCQMLILKPTVPPLTAEPSLTLCRSAHSLDGDRDKSLDQVLSSANYISGGLPSWVSAVIWVQSREEVRWDLEPERPRGSRGDPSSISSPSHGPNHNQNGALPALGSKWDEKVPNLP